MRAQKTRCRLRLPAIGQEKTNVVPVHATARRSTRCVQSISGPICQISQTPIPITITRTFMVIRWDCHSDGWSTCVESATALRMLNISNHTIAKKIFGITNIRIGFSQISRAAGGLQDLTLRRPTTI